MLFHVYKPRMIAMPNDKRSHILGKIKEASEGRWHLKAEWAFAWKGYREKAESQSWGSIRQVQNMVGDAAGLTGEEWNMAGKGRWNWTGAGVYLECQAGSSTSVKRCQKTTKVRALWIFTWGSAVLIGWEQSVGVKGSLSGCFFRSSVMTCLAIWRQAKIYEKIRHRLGCCGDKLRCQQEPGESHQLGDRSKSMCAPFKGGSSLLNSTRAREQGVPNT